MRTLGEGRRLYTELACGGSEPLFFETWPVMHRIVYVAGSAAILAMLFFVGAPVKAADDPANVASVPPGGDSKDIEEIVVTARRPAESRCRVPVSVAGLDSRTLG